MELVRTTEYAALAARPLDRARREGVGRRRRRGRDAPDARHRLDGRPRGDRRGREGRGADALQRRARSATARRRRSTSPSTRSRAPSCAPRACRTRIATIALSERGTMFDPGPCVYMLKMATSRDMAHLLDLDRPLPETLELMAKEKGVDVGDIVVIMLDRPRHEEAMAEIREAGARIRLIPHGDVSAALAGGDAGLAGRSALGHRRHARGRARRRRDQVHRRPDPRPALAAQRRGAPGRARGRLRPRRGARHQPPRVRATTCTSPPPASPTATCSTACTTSAGGRHHRVARRCARARAPCARSPPATTARSCARSPRSGVG